MPRPISLVSAALLLAACGSSGQATQDSGKGDVVAATPDVSTGDQSAALGADVPTVTINVDGPLVDSGGGPGPVVTAINRHGVPPEGGALVLFVGQNFVAPATVLFGIIASPQVSVLSSTQLTTVAPAHTIGPVDLTVINPDGTSTVVTGQFEFAPAPVLTGIAPTFGPHEGGTQVVISGSNLRAVQVLFSVRSSSVAPIVGAPSATSVTVATAAMEIGTATISVVNSDGQSATLAGAFISQ